MPLSGVHIAWGLASPGAANQAGQSTLPSGNPTDGETMAASAVSVSSAPSAPGGTQSLLSISASIAIYYVTGPSVTTAQLANAGTGRVSCRYYDPVQSPGREDIFVNSKDFFAWVAA